MTRSAVSSNKNKRRPAWNPLLLVFSSWILPAVLLCIHLHAGSLVVAATTSQSEQDETTDETEDDTKTFFQAKRSLLFGGSGSGSGSGSGMDGSRAAADINTRSAGESCTNSDQCEGGLECNEFSANNSMRCMANKECMKRELTIMGSQFDPVAYKSMLFEESGYTEQDIWGARKEYKNNHTEFANSPPVQALMHAIHQHQQELVQIAHIITQCEEEPEVQSEPEEQPQHRRRASGAKAKAQQQAQQQQQQQASEEEAGTGGVRRERRELQFGWITAGANALRGAGAFVGSLFASALGLTAETTSPAPSSTPSVAPSVSQIPTISSAPTTSKAPSASPTISNAPSVSAQPSAQPTMFPSIQPSVSNAPTATPSTAPTRSLLSTTYVGFHMEGGFLIDGSYSLYSYGQDPINRLYGRSCLGFEAGAGAEIGIAVLVTQNRYVNDLVGGSLLLDIDIALGAAFGLGGGVFVSGDTTVDRPLHYEVTIGSGLGAGLIGFSVCRTLRIQ